MISSREIQAIVKFWLGIGESRPLMQIERPTIIYRCWLGLLLLLGQLYSPAAVTAETRIVVVPLGGNDVEQHPVGTTFTNRSGMHFNLLPAGEFVMGSPSTEPGRNVDETEHRVTLSKPFYMQTTEVSNEQWNALIFDTGLGAKPSSSHVGIDYPVDSINWYEAVYFANRVSITEGKSSCYTLTACTALPGAGMSCAGVNIIANCTGYRLPTEAEWEYAARATTTVAYATPVNFNGAYGATGAGFNPNLDVMGWYVYNNSMEPSGGVNGDTADESGTKPLHKSRQTPGGCMICMLMSWSSPKIGGIMQ